MRRPLFIAEHSRHAKGLLGRVVAWVMARETHGDNQRAIKALNLQSSDHVLDIGTGHGRALAQLVELVPFGAVTGVDPSELMTRLARERNDEAVLSGQLRVIVAGVEALPFEDGSFDKAMAVHVIYFWPDLARSLGEIARILKPGGQLVLVFRTSDDAAAVNAFPDGIYTFRSGRDISDAMACAGLVSVSEAVGLDDAFANSGGATLLIARKPG